MTQLDSYAHGASALLLRTKGLALASILMILFAGSAFSDGGRDFPNNTFESGLPAETASTPVDPGYRTFNYGSAVIDKPTAEKPESKLWWHDGSWWSCLWDPNAAAYRIHRLDLANQSWLSVGPNVDDRGESLCDALSSGATLYIASHIYDGSGDSHLYSYEYDADTRTYSSRPGFPVAINDTGPEALTIERDTSGQLWATWQDGGDIWVNRSLTSDSDWGEPFVLPTQESEVSSDDVSTIVAFDGKIGVLWSNQKDERNYFASHIDSNADMTWETREIALENPDVEDVADDHINAAAYDGHVYMISKASTSGEDEIPQIYLAHRNPSGIWTYHIAGTRGDDFTRVLLLIDAENRRLLVFAKSDNEVHGAIRMKTSDLDEISFAAGPGEIVLHSDDDDDINNPTATKQPINATTGLLLLASDEGSHYYLHNYMEIEGATAAPDISVSPGSHVYATVPVGSSSEQRFEVRNAGRLGLEISGTSIVGSNPADFALTSGGGDFTLVPGATQDVVVRFAPSSIGAMSATLRIESNDPNESTVDVSLLGSGSGTDRPPSTGVVAFEGSTSGTVSDGLSVTTPTYLAGPPGDIYLAAVTSKKYAESIAVSGMSLTWTKLRAQCGGRHHTGSDVWLGEGTANDGTVTATFSESTTGAIVVTRYSGADPIAPIGSVISVNTNGANGDCDGGSDNSAYAFSLPTSVNGAMVFVAVAKRSKQLTPDADFTLREDVTAGSGGGRASIATLDQRVRFAGSVSVNGTFDEPVDWAVVAVELRPGGRAPGRDFASKRNQHELEDADSTDNPTARARRNKMSHDARAQPEAEAAERSVPNVEGTILSATLQVRDVVQSGGALFELASPVRALLHVAVYDARGRRLQTLWQGSMPAGRVFLEWNGENESSRPVPSGIYFARANIGRQALTQKFILLR